MEKLTGKTITFYRVDITDKGQLSNVFKKVYPPILVLLCPDTLLFQHKVDCVIHFAALKAVGESVEKPLEYYRNNLLGALVLLEVRLQFIP